MTAFFCSRSACGFNVPPRSSTDDRICRNWMRVRPDVSCASRSIGSSERALNHSASRAARRNSSRSASSGRSTSISTVCGERTTRELTSARFSVTSTIGHVRRKQRRDRSTTSGCTRAWRGLRRSIRRPTPGSAFRHTGNITATPSSDFRCTTCFRNESSSAQNATGSRGRVVEKLVPCTASTVSTVVHEVLVRIAGVEDRAVRALVLDDDVALPEHPLAEEPCERQEVARSSVSSSWAFGAGSRSSVLPCSRNVLPRRARMPCASVCAQRG